jgi:Xaa-Pro aminopeptidase
VEWLSRQKSLRRIGIEGAHMTVAERRVYSGALTKGVRLVETSGLVEQLRMIKDADEIGCIREACRVGVELFEKLVKVLRPGVKETEAAGELEFAARRAGVEQMSFSTIIAGGVRSALPHGRASAAPIPAEGFVVCDFGVILAGYCSDMTRTPHVGRPAAEARSVYEAVQDSQQAALEAVKPGASVGEVDRAARNLLQDRSLGKYFIHSTGHGVGLEIHEAPRIATGQNEMLQPGMVVTIEPGIYLPGKWGVRIEDTVVVTETGHEVLTPCPKSLLAL